VSHFYDEEIFNSYVLNTYIGIKNPYEALSDEEFVKNMEGFYSAGNLAGGYGHRQCKFVSTEFVERLRREFGVKCIHGVVDSDDLKVIVLSNSDSILKRKAIYECDYKGYKIINVAKLITEDEVYKLAETISGSGLESHVINAIENITIKRLLLDFLPKSCLKKLKKEEVD
jgi:hypothetical protein